MSSYKPEPGNHNVKQALGQSLRATVWVATPHGEQTRLCYLSRVRLVNLMGGIVTQSKQANTFIHLLQSVPHSCSLTLSCSFVSPNSLPNTHTHIPVHTHKQLRVSWEMLLSLSLWHSIQPILHVQLHFQPSISCTAWQFSAPRLKVFLMGVN